MTVTASRQAASGLGLQPCLLRERYTPPATTGARRSRLVSAAQNVPIVSIEAPFGFGKTTLMSHLVGRGAWLTMHRTLDSPEALPRYLLAAAHPADPRRIPQANLPLGSIDAMTCLTEHLLMPLSKSSAPFTLCIDDLQTVRAPATWQAITFLVTHRPTALRLRLASRTPISQALDLAIEDDEWLRIDAAALRFRPDEVTRAFGPEVDDRSSGWAVGLVLEAQHLRNQTRRVGPLSEEPEDAWPFA